MNIVGGNKKLIVTRDRKPKLSVNYLRNRLLAISEFVYKNTK